MNKSKANLERRQKATAARLDRSWQPMREDPVLEGGNFHYEVSGRVEAINCGGVGMLQAVVESSGLRPAIDEMVVLLKRHLPYHESDHVLALTYNLLTGGQCLEDLEQRRNDVAFLNALGAHRIPDPTTAGDFLRRFDASSVTRLMEAIDRARRNVWRQQPQADRKLAIIDVDGTIVETSGRSKEKIDISYDGQWGYCPLVVSLANTQEVLSVVNRPANRPSHDGAAPWLDKAVAWAKEDGGFERVRLRGDTDFSLTTNFDRWTESDVEFVFGMDAHPSFVARAQQLSEDCWKPMVREERTPQRKRPPNVKKEVVEQRGFRALTLAEEHFAEMEYQPTKAEGTYRMIALRKRIHVKQGQLQLADEIRYFFYVTNISAEKLSAASVVRQSNARCHQENLIEQLKNGVLAMRMPVREFDANWAYMVIGALAWNLKAWAGLLLPKALGARTILKMEFRRFLNELILLPAQILRSGRRLIFRLLAINRWSTLLLKGTRYLRRRCVV